MIVQPILLNPTIGKDAAQHAAQLIACDAMSCVIILAGAEVSATSRWTRHEVMAKAGAALLPRNARTQGRLGQSAALVAHTFSVERDNRPGRAAEEGLLRPPSRSNGGCTYEKRSFPVCACKKVAALRRDFQTPDITR